MGAYDDIPTIPGSVATTGGGTYDDIPAVSADEQRRQKLRKMALEGMKKWDGEPGASDLYSNSYTLGLQKPVGGVAAALGGEVGELFGGEPATFGERYGAHVGARDDYLNEARQKSGWAGTAADVAGSITAGGPARDMLTQAAASLPRLMAQATGLGAVEGAANNSEDLGSAAWGGLTGGVTSGAATGILGGLIDYGKSLLPGARAAREVQREVARGPHPDEIERASKDLFRVLDQGGVAYDVNQSTQLADDIMTQLVQGGGGWDPQGAHKVLGGVVERIEGMRGQPLSLETLQQIRSQAGANARDINPAVREASGRILNSIDGYIRQVTPAQSALPPGQDVGPLWEEARRLWRTKNLISDINWKVDKAGRRAASTNSGQNEENAIRQNIRGTVDKATQPGRFNPYTAPQIEQMERVVRGTPAQNAIRSTGNHLSGLTPGMTAGSLAGVGTMLGMGGQMDTASNLLTAGAGLAAGAVPMLGGRALKAQSTRMAQDEADSLVRLFSTGSLDRLPVPPSQNVPTRATLYRTLLAQSLARSPGRWGDQ